MSHMNDFLPIPDSYESILTPANRLPLEYVSSDWGLLVCEDPQRREWQFSSGSHLHSHWETSTSIHRFSPGSNNFPPGAIQVECPDGSILAIHITFYAPPSSTSSRKKKLRISAKPLS
jgi:hypothetical protein